MSHHNNYHHQKDPSYVERTTRTGPKPSRYNSQKNTSPLSTDNEPDRRVHVPDIPKSRAMNYVIFSEALGGNQSSTPNDNNDYPSGFLPSNFIQQCYQSPNPRFSVRVTNTEERVDPAGSTYTVYIIQVESNKNNEHSNIPMIHTQSIEHRYSEFSRLNKELEANSIELRSSFPSKSLVGRIGNWTPAARFAPSRMHEMVTFRKIKLDIWLVELVELLGSGGIVGNMKDQVVEFLTVSAGAPCNRANFVQWEGLDSNVDAHSNDGASDTQCSHYTTIKQEEDMLKREGKHASGGGFAEKYLPNPISFTMGAEIRKAVYTVMHMFGSTSTVSMEDRSIPLDLLHKSWGLCFLTVVKAGFMVSGRVGTGLVIARTSDGGWSPPSAVGTLGVGWGALIGGDITTYLIVLNTKNAVRAFASPNVNLGAEVDVAVGPIGRGGTGNLNASSGSGVVAAYSYAHSKGLFLGLSLEGSVITTRKDVNAKFYGKRVNSEELLFSGGMNKPRAAMPLYDALDEATKVGLDRGPFRTRKSDQGNKYLSGDEDT